MDISSLLHVALSAAVEAGEAIMNIYRDPELSAQVDYKADHSPLTQADRKAHGIIAKSLEDTPFPLLSEEGAHESYERRKDWETLWIVDPLDGTKEFVGRNGEFTVNIALVHRQTPVMGVIYVPVMRRLFWGVTKDVSAEPCAHTADVDEKGNLIHLQTLPDHDGQEGKNFTVVASRSHLNESTATFIENMRTRHPRLGLHSAGSSLKICLVAEGKADIYPRLAPTMEWDTAAGHAIAVAAGCFMIDSETRQPLRYNKPDLHNPFFIVGRDEKELPPA